jgi:hypothetical protein
MLANSVSDTFALRYALLIVGAVQLLSIVVAKRILRGCGAAAQAEEVQPDEPLLLCPVGEQQI